MRKKELDSKKRKPKELDLQKNKRDSELRRKKLR
jgi:hypothetical protein